MITGIIIAAAVAVLVLRMRKHAREQKRRNGFRDNAERRARTRRTEYFF